MSIWNSKESVSAVAQRTNWIGVVLVVIGGVFSMISIVASGRRDELQKIEDQTKDARIESAHKIAEDERAARLKSEADNAWRRLTKEQEERLSARIPFAFPGTVVAVASYMGDQEAAHYAAEIAACLRLAGWTINAPGMLVDPGVMPKGIILQSPNLNTDAPKLLWKIFQDSGIDLRAEPAMVRNGSMQIVVATKPRP